MIPAATIRATSMMLLMCLGLLAPGASLSAAGVANEQQVPGTLLAGPLEGNMGRMGVIAFHDGVLFTVPEIPASESGSDHLVRTWDVSNPRSPRVLKTWGVTAHPFSAHGYYKRPNYLTLGSDTNSYRSLGGGNFEKFNPSDIGPAGGRLMLHEPFWFTNWWSYGDSRSDAQIFRNGQVIARWDHLGQTGVFGHAMLVGDLLIYASEQSNTGIATYDVSDMRNPRLLDTFNTAQGIGGYWPEMWGSYVVWPDQRGFMHAVDFSDPSNLRHVGSIPLVRSSPGPMYVQAQDEFVFIDRSKIDMRTMKVVLELNTHANQTDASQYALPVGNLLFCGGFRPYEGLSIYAHQAEPDKRGPFVAYHRPLAGQTRYSRECPITLVIHETLEIGSIRNGETVIVRPVGGSPIACDITFTHNDLLQLTPRQSLAADTTYEVVVPAGGILDAVGNGITPYSFRFTTGTTLVGAPGGGVGSGPVGQAPTVTLVQPTNGASVLNTSAITFSATASDADGQVQKVEFLVGTTVIGTDTTAPYSVTWTAPTLGTHSVRARATDNDGLTGSSATAMITVREPSGPYGGTARAIPGRIEAEHFDTGGEGVAYHDTDTVNQGGTTFRGAEGVDIGGQTSGTRNVGWTADGEWLNYTVNVSAGRYRVSLAVASALVAPGSAKLSINGKTLSAAVPGTGAWGTYQNLNLGSLDLSAGTHVLRLDIIGGNFNVDVIEFVAETVTPVPTVAITAPLEGATISASATVSFTTTNWTIAANGRHVHLLVDGVDKGPHYSAAPIPIGTLAPGNHRLEIGLYEADHTPRGITHSVNVVVPMPNTEPIIAGLAFDVASPVAVGRTVRVTVSASDADGDVLSYRYDFGDGSPRTDWISSASATHAFAPGIHTVQVQVRDTDGFVGAITKRMVVYRAPVAAAGRASSQLALDQTGGRLWTVNPDNNSVTRIDLATRATAEFAVPAHPFSCALDAAGRLWVACRDADALVAIDASGTLLRRVNLPYGAAPTAVVFPSGSAQGYVAESGSGSLRRIDGATGVLGARVNLGGAVHSLALSGDGQTLFAARFISANVGGQIHRLRTSDLARVGEISLPVDSSTTDSTSASRGVPNYVTGLLVDHYRNELRYVAKKDNILRGLARDGKPMNFENVTRSLVGRIDTAGQVEKVDGRTDIDNTSQPVALAFNATGTHLVVALQGNNKLHILDAETGGNEAVVLVGKAPQAVVVDAAGRIYAKSFLDRRIDIIDASAIFSRGEGEPTAQLSVRTVASERLSPTVLRGKQLFYNAEDTRLAQDGYISCAACHLDGAHDGRTWDFTDRGEGLRNTTDLRGRRGMGHGLVHWSGNFDEIQDFEHDIRGHFGGTGLLSATDFTASGQPLGAPKAGRNADLDALAAYVSSLETMPRSPHRNADGSMTATAKTGEAIFKRLDCASCHSGADFTDSSLQLRLHNVGTLTATSGSRLGGTLSGIDTPTLLGIWDTAPFFHDGSAQDLSAVITRSGSAHGAMAALTTTDRTALVAYLQQLDGSSTNPGRAVSGGGDGQAPFTQAVVVTATGSSRIQAEDYDRGGAGVAWNDVDAVNQGGTYRQDGVDIGTTTDSGGGYNVGWIRAGEWLEYSIEVAQAGTYRLDLRVARLPGGSSALHLERDGQAITGSIAVPSTGGWQTWTTIATEVNLSAGPQIVRVVMDVGDINFNWFALTRSTGGSNLFPGVAINFQPVSVATPAGWIPDTSSVFGDRGNGFSYGWTTAFNETRDRNAATAPDQLHDTLNHLQKGGTNRVWELAVPSGSYEVTILRGDPSYTDQVNHLLVEGVRMADPDGQDAFDRDTVMVEVSDGRLTVRPADDAFNAKICAISVKKVPTSVSGFALRMPPAVTDSLTRHINPSAASERVFDVVPVDVREVLGYFLRAGGTIAALSGG